MKVKGITYSNIVLSGHYNLTSGKEVDFNSYLEHIETDLRNHKKHNKTSIEKLAAIYGITNKNLVKETTELAIVKIARSLANQKDKSEYERYIDIVELYNNQVNLSHRTSQSMLMQQYSTAAPISYIASLYVSKGNDAKSHYFEPSAGNGLLTIALPMQNTIVNEVDDVRLRHLQMQEFEFVSNQDALMPFPEYYKTFDGVVTNPPFGTLDEPIIYDGFRIKHLDHVMTLRALDTMKNDGKAAIIIGGHTAWDDKGRVQAGKNRIFLNYLYSHYNVDDILLINGHKLYSRQGTAFNTRLILIDGRKEKREGFAPLKTNEAETEMKDFEDLWDRVFGKTQNKKIKQKEIWEMTELEYAKIKKPKTYIEITSVSSDYDYAVREAIKREKNIPKKVLKEYKKQHPSDTQRKKTEKQAYKFVDELLKENKIFEWEEIRDWVLLKTNKLTYKNLNINSIKKFHKETAFSIGKSIDLISFDVNLSIDRSRSIGTYRNIILEKDVQKPHAELLTSIENSLKLLKFNKIFDVYVKYDSGEIKIFQINKDPEPLINNKQKRIRIAKVKAQSKLRLLSLLKIDSLNGNETDFNKQILLYKQGKLPVHSVLDLGKPASILLEYGIIDENIKLRQSVIKKALNKHNLLISDFIGMNNRVDKPNAIFQSKQFETTKIIIINKKDLKGHPVMIAISGKNNEINNITSVHGRIKRQIKLWEKQGLLLYKRKNFDF